MVSPMVHPPAPAPPPEPRRARQLLLFAAIIGCGLFAYWGVWRGSYVFDDGVAILGNAPLQAGDWWHAALGDQHQPLANRPLACLTLVLDWHLFGPGPFGPHLMNLVLHLLNACLLFATLRRTLLAPNLAGRVAPERATWLAAAVSVIWVAHPLGVDAVAYVTQRSTLLADGFWLLAVYGTLRAHASRDAIRWRALVVAALCCSLAGKEDAIVGPLLLVLFERAFLLPSWSSMQRRLGYYLAVALSWSVLAACLLLGPNNPTVGFATRNPVTAWQWSMTQAGVVVHYLEQALWPHDLRGAYDWGVVEHLGDAWRPGLLVLLLLGITVACWRRRPWWGWLGALFFLWLAPTSSVMPIVTEIAAERRAYLPMLLVLVPVVIAGDRIARAVLPAGRRWLLGVPVLAAVLLLGRVTHARVAVYDNSPAFWDDAWSKSDPDSRTFVAGMILTNRGDTLLSQGREQEGYACHDLAIQCANPTPQRFLRHALSLLGRKRYAEALTIVRTLAADTPSDNVLGGLGMCLAANHEAEGGRPDDPRLDEAETALRRARASAPAHAQYWNALGYVLRVHGDFAGAEEAYRQVIEQRPPDATPWLLRAEMLERLGRAAEIPPLLEDLLAARPTDVGVRLHLAELVRQSGNRDFAIRILQDVLRIEPGNADATGLLRQMAPEGR
jgi:tetratricopeptide (TPR) repeat protein